MNAELIKKVEQIKADTGAINVYVDDRYANPIMIPIYNEGQIAFMHEVLSDWSFFRDSLIELFETKESSLTELRRMYSNLIDFD